MKKRKTTLLAFSLLTFTALGTAGLTACSCAENTDSISTVVIQGAKNGSVGDTIQLSATVIGDSENLVTWESNDVAVATVNESGLVTLVVEGTALITARSVKNPNASSTPTQINVYKTLEKRLEVLSMPSKTSYKIGDKISFDGLSVMGFGYANGVKDNTTGENIDLSTLTFSIQNGATLDNAGNVVVTVSKSGYVSTSFTVTVGENAITRKLYISRFPSKTVYVIGSENDNAFATTGLRVRELVYVDGVLDNAQSRDLNSNEYSLSLNNGYVFKDEGNYTIDVTSTSPNVAPTSFNVTVYTRDLSVYDIVKNLQNSKNYTVEVLNNVGTTNDATGFHYVRTYTENYYDDIEYQNVNNGTEIVFDTTNIKAHFGYTVYGEKGTVDRSIIQYREDSNGNIVGGKKVSSDPDIESWWERGDALARMFSLFDLNLIPTYTFDGRFLATNIEVVPNDDDMGTKTALKYPLVADFLEYCGWSSNLITIMNRFSISFNEDGNLSMLAEFGSYGTTEMIVKDIGNSRNLVVEQYLNMGLVGPDVSVDPEVVLIADILRKNNYTTVDYGENGINKDGVSSYFNEDYYYNVGQQLGFAKVTVNGQDFIQQFTVEDNVYTPAVNEDGTAAELIEIPEGKTFAKTFNEQISTTGNYIAENMVDVFGTGGTDTGLLNTFSLYEGMSSSTNRTYQSFDTNALRSYNDYLGVTDDQMAQEGMDIKQNRLWFIATYNFDTYTEENLDTLEIWNINGVTLRGNVLALANLGKTSVDWIESGIAEQERILNSASAQ